MKKELWVVMSLFLWTSCIVQKNPKQKNESVNLDSWELPSYPDFYLSYSSKVNFEFQDMGKIYSRLIFDYNPIKKGNTISDHYSGNPIRVIDHLHQNALEIGANGIIDLQVEYIPTIPPSFYSSGKAIKRK